MSQTPDDPAQTPHQQDPHDRGDQHDQDSEPASEPAGAAEHGDASPEQDAGPASEPAGGADAAS